MKKILWISLLLFGSSFGLSAQSQHQFWKDVKIIKQYDQLYTPPKEPVLFVGSSSIRKWPNLQKTFCDHIVMNRGVGGTVINDIIYFADDLIFDYQPAKIILYVGENDLVEAGATADTIFQRFKNLYTLIESKLPGIPIAYIAMKPSPSREKYFQKAVDGNALIKAYLKNKPHATFIDIFPLMLTKEGKMRPELFVSDMLHMNEKGYEIWEKAVRPVL